MVSVNLASTLNAPAGISQAVANASAKTGVDFSYLMHKAAQESSFDANAKAKTSSATGLYQFIEKTWLKMVKDHGATYGLGKYASQINDDLTVKDQSIKTQILDLRKDPQTSAIMAAEFTKENQDQLQSAVGGKIGETELYMAHFMGAGGATKFLNAMKSNPGQIASTLFPKEASANPGVFTNKDTGASLTLGQIYNRFAAKFSEAPSVVKPIDTASMPTLPTSITNLMSPLSFDTVSWSAQPSSSSTTAKDQTGIASLNAIFSQTSSQNAAFLTSLIASSMGNPLDQKDARQSNWNPATAVGL